MQPSPTNNTVAILGLAVAGIVGIVGPVVTSLFAERRLTRQLAHERRLGDLDHIRNVLDEFVATGEKISDKLVFASVKYMNDETEEGLELVTEAIHLTGSFYAKGRRLALRRGASDPLVLSAETYRVAVVEACAYLNDAATPGAFDDAESSRHQEAIGAGYRQLVDVAAASIGTKDPDL